VSSAVASTVVGAAVDTARKDTEMNETTNEPTKTCVKCDEPKPLSGFYRRSSSPDGHHNTCKSCQEARRRAQPPSPPAQDGTKRCPRCELEKHVTEFGRSSQAADGRYWYCRPCVSERYREKRQSPAAAAREARKASARW
jgi:hypothetical protein